MGKNNGFKRTFEQVDALSKLLRNECRDYLLSLVGDSGRYVVAHNDVLLMYDSVGETCTTTVRGVLECPKGEIAFETDNGLVIYTHADTYSIYWVCSKLSELE